MFWRPARSQTNERPFGEPKEERRSTNRKIKEELADSLKIECRYVSIIHLRPFLNVTKEKGIDKMDDTLINI